MKTTTIIRSLTLGGSLLLSSSMMFSQPYSDACRGLPSQSDLRTALKAARAASNGGFNLDMWGTVVNRDGVVCAVAFTGADRGSQWPGSRVISAQKANTANAFSLDASSFSNGSGQKAGLALATANLYSAVQPGGSLYGLQASNPVDPKNAYSAWTFTQRDGTKGDSMKDVRVGGVNVFGGGLALYAAGHRIVGGLGVSGDTSCADHNIAWRVRNLLELDHMAATDTLPAVPGPASLFANDPTHPDNIIFDITENPNGGSGKSASGFGHPSCLNTNGSNTLPPVRP